MFGGIQSVQSTDPKVNLREGKKPEEELRRQHTVLKGINTIFAEAFKCVTDEDLGKICLKVAEEITGSKFGFIAGVAAEGLIFDIAISNPGWELCRLSNQAGHRRIPSNFKDARNLRQSAERRQESVYQ